jgi:hypothetical protein
MNVLSLFVATFFLGLRGPPLGLKVALLITAFFFGLLAALFGMKAAFQLSSASPARRPSTSRLAPICVLAALLIYPAFFAALQFEFHVVAKGNPGAQAGMLALVIAMGFCGLARTSFKTGC